MPNIFDANLPLEVLPNLFVSPFGNDETVPLYSSIPVGSSLAQGCLPCVVCGVGVQNLSRVLSEITQLANLVATGTLNGNAGSVVSPGGSFYDPNTIPVAPFPPDTPPPDPPDPPAPPPAPPPTPTIPPSVPSFLEIDLDSQFPNKPGVPVGDFYGFQTFGPHLENRWVYSHEADPAGADDDLVINGTVVDPDNVANYVFDGARTLLVILNAGSTFTVDVRQGTIGGNCLGFGRIRLYDQLLP